MDKFRISQVRDYFLRSNETGASFKNLSGEDLVSLAVLSVFDKSGKTVKTASVEYQRPDGIIDENEFNLSKADYDKMLKSINKEIKKEKGKEISALNIPSYEDLQAMMKEDKKIDFDELHLFARERIIREPGVEKPKPVQIPAKSGNNELTLDEKQAYLEKVFSDPHKEAVLSRVEARLDEAERTGKTAYDFTVLNEAISLVEKQMNDFKPDDDISYNIQAGIDGLQFNSKGQRVTRINNTAGYYEKYAYKSDDSDAKYSEMVRYNGDGYKTDYFRRMRLVDEEGSGFEGIVIYHLDENEKVCKITYPENAAIPDDISDFNDYKLYEQVTRYYSDLEKSNVLSED